MLILLPPSPQVNYLGPFLLTRLLEPCLVASAPSRVVNVSSVTHRYGRLDNPARFLSRSAAGVGGKYPVGVVLCLHFIAAFLGHAWKDLSASMHAVDVDPCCMSAWRCWRTQRFLAASIPAWHAPHP